jgi:Transposase DDE domain group 1
LEQRFLPKKREVLSENVVAFYNKRGTCEQWIKEGKGAIRWTRLSCRSFAANAVRL